MGCTVKRGADRAEIARFGRLYGVGRVFTGVYPGLATDAAPLLAAAMLCAEGESSIEDVVFEERFGCAEGFERLGGRAKRAGRVLSVGPLPESGLHGTTLLGPGLHTHTVASLPPLRQEEGGGWRTPVISTGVTRA